MTSNTSAGKKAHIKLAYLDGFRGLAALYVVIFHAVEVSEVARLPKWLQILISPLQCGHFSVSAFIVLSGYCLMLPVARTKECSLRGGIPGFFFRRAKRILPPYYLTLLFSLVLIALFHYEEAPTLGNLTAHIFLVHNFRALYFFSINPPLWSVAAEWQIYFVFALLLLPFFRRFGLMPMLTLATLLGIVPCLLRQTYVVQLGCSWYITLFAFGMAGAVINFAPDKHYHRMERQILWSSLAYILLIATTMYVILFFHRGFPWSIGADVLTGGCATCFLIACTRAINDKEENPLALQAIMERKYAIQAGHFSYSLYLTHGPIVVILSQALKRTGLSHLTCFVLLLCVFTPLLILTYYGIYHVMKFFTSRKAD